MSTKLGFEVRSTASRDKAVDKVTDVVEAVIDWIAAMIWAQTKPAAQASTGEDVDVLKARVAVLETRLTSPTEASS